KSWRWRKSARAPETAGALRFSREPSALPDDDHALHAGGLVDGAHVGVPALLGELVPERPLRLQPGLEALAGDVMRHAARPVPHHGRALRNPEGRRDELQPADADL